MEKKLKNLTMGTDNYLKKYGKIKKPQRNNFNEKNGVIERMDKRMNNVITKIR